MADDTCPCPRCTAPGPQKPLREMLPQPAERVDFKVLMRELERNHAEMLAWLTR